MVETISQENNPNDLSNHSNVPQLCLNSLFTLLSMNRVVAGADIGMGEAIQQVSIKQ